MSEKARKAAESIVAAYHEMNRMLPLAGGIPRPIEESTDKATVVALAYLAERESEAGLVAALLPIVKEIKDKCPHGNDTLNPDWHVELTLTVHECRALLDGYAKAEAPTHD